MENPDIHRILSEVADLLEIQGGNPFRIRAYRNAVHTVSEQTVPFRRMLEEGRDLTELPGIGKEMASHIQELVETGELGLLDQLSAEIPRSLVTLKRLPGVGPKKAKKLWEELEIETIDQLEAAAKKGKVAELDGFGEKSQAKILTAIDDYRKHSERTRIDKADEAIRPMLEALRGLDQVERLEVAGSYRRRKETVGDIDLLAIATEPEPVMSAFTGHSTVARIEMSGPTRGSVVLHGALEVDLRIVPPESYGAALVYFTGSKEHNVKLRIRAVERGLKVSEYGVYRVTKEERAADDTRAGKLIAGRTEEEVYEALDLAFVPPVLREDRGEIEAAEEGTLPRLVTADDLRGDLHMHSTWSDGRNSIEEMVTACEERGYAYLAITDHSKALAMTGGLDAKRLREQWQEIAEVQARHPDIRILRGQEVDILQDGSLDQDDDALEGLDIVLISVHSHFELPAAEQTERILRAVAHPQVNLLCHPTGRLIGRRKPMQFDLDAVLEACAEHRVAVEVNSSPQRLDLKDTHLLRARELGIPIAINTDAHITTGLAQRRYGIDQAQRAWVGPDDVLNCRGLEGLLEWIGQKD
jgi:DNA polymerase (family 10)